MTQTTTYAGRAGAAEADAGPWARLGKAWADYRLYRATVRELVELSDRELADLGIHRSLIREIARSSVYAA